MVKVTTGGQTYGGRNTNAVLKYALCEAGPAVFIRRHEVLQVGHAGNRVYFWVPASVDLTSLEQVTSAFTEERAIELRIHGKVRKL